ncbi:MAG: hypothetical protein ABI969_16250 [bacterium]
MPSRCFTRFGFLVATLAFTASCQDDTSVNPRAEPFDAAGAMTKFEPVAAVLDQGIFTSFEGELPVFEHFFRSGDSSPGIPPGVIGSTFVYDPASKLYVVDPNATGTPATGVRFVLYAWDQTRLAPATPLTRVGFVDLAPANGSNTGEATRILIMRDAGQTAIADFVVAHGATPGLQTFGIAGTATDGSTTMSIAVDGTRTDANPHHLVFDVTLSSPALGVRAVERLTFDQATAALAERLELNYDGHTLTDENVGNGLEVKFDGALYSKVVLATAGQSTKYLKPDGSALAERDVADLKALLNRVVATNFFWIELVWP